MVVVPSKGYTILVEDESTAVVGAVTYGEVHASSMNNLQTLGSFL